MSQTAAKEIVSDNAVLYLPDGQTIELPVLTGTENEKAMKRRAGLALAKPTYPEKPRSFGRGESNRSSRRGRPACSRPLVR